MKRIFIFLSLIMAVVGLQAQTLPGFWELFPSYGTPSKVIDTDKTVYVLAGTSLCGYDKATGEVMAFNMQNRLNAYKVSGCWYNYDLQCLFIVYDDFNIDILYEDGRTVNMSDLRDAAIRGSRTVNDVAFADGKAFMALASGLLIVDITHGVVLENALFDKNIARIVATDDFLVLSLAGDSKLYVGKKTGLHNNFASAFTPSTAVTLATTNYSGMLPLGGNNIALQNAKDDKIYFVNIADDGTVTATLKGGIGKYPMTRTKTGGVMGWSGATTSTSKTLVYMTADGTYSTVVVPSATTSMVFSDRSGTKETVWAADPTGYGQQSLATSAESRWPIAQVRPAGTSGSNVGLILPASDGRLYLHTITLGNEAISMDLPNAVGKKNNMDILSNNNISAVKSSPSGFCFSVRVNPSNPNEYLSSIYSSAVYRINVETNTITTYNQNNSGLVGGGIQVADINFDPEGNPWFLQRYNNSHGTLMHMVKAEDWNSETLSADNWQTHDLGTAINPNLSARFAFHPNGYIIYTLHEGIGAINTQNTWSDLSDDKFINMDVAIDEDGMSFSGAFKRSIVVDKQGWTWVGTNGGLFVIKDPAKMFESGFAPMRPKVPRNDGTNLADFLCDNVEVFCIAVDGNDHKWIGTTGSGIYHVSKDGTEILEHLTTETSDLPSNNVLAIYPDLDSNKIYVGTDQGLSIYHSGSMAASANYDNVYAYPNPVTPDYTGVITITGLMDGSLVKIADAAGRVFHQVTSDGGMVQWDGTDATTGHRVKSGVYFVYASKSGDQSAAAVTKIVVVN